MMLTIDERTRFEMYEEILARNYNSTLEFSKALAAIAEEKLYREEYHTFEDYCNTRWGFSGRRGRQIKNMGQLLISLEKSGTTVPLSNEAQARELLKVSEEKRTEVLHQIEGPVTAEKIRSAADELEGMTPQQQLATIQAHEAELMSEADRERRRGLYQSIIRSLDKSYNWCSQIGPEADNLADQINEGIRIAADLGNWNLPKRMQ